MLGDFCHKINSNYIGFELLISVTSKLWSRPMRLNRWKVCCMFMLQSYQHIHLTSEIILDTPWHLNWSKENKLLYLNILKTFSSWGLSKYAVSIWIWKWKTKTITPNKIKPQNKQTRKQHKHVCQKKKIINFPPVFHNMSMESSLDIKPNTPISN